MTFDRQARALLDLVQSDRDTQITSNLREARARADALRSEAHAQARARVRRAFTEERQRRDARIAAAVARVATRRRLSEQRRSLAALELAWGTLNEAVARRWTDAPSRAQWIASVSAQARQTLRRDAVTIVHAPDLTAQERAALATAFTEGGCAQPAFVADPRIHAGLKVNAGGNVIDGTLDGLLADRTDIGARLLHRMHLE